MTVPDVVIGKGGWKGGVIVEMGKPKEGGGSKPKELVWSQGEGGVVEEGLNLIMQYIDSPLSRTEDLNIIPSDCAKFFAVSYVNYILLCAWKEFIILNFN